MSEEPLTYGELPLFDTPVMPTARVWATSTDLAGTDKERKQYFIILDDGEKRIQFSLHVHADGLLRVEPYVEHEYDYTQYDDWDEDEGDYESSYYDEDECEVSGDDEPEETAQEEAEHD